MEKARSVYRRGAEDGLLMGPLLAAVVICFGATVFVPSLLLPSLLLMMAVPGLSFYMLRRSFAEDKFRSPFAALWLHGICIFFFGGLIMSIATYAAMRWIWPHYVIDLMNLAIDVARTSPNHELAQMSDTLQKAIDAGNMPTPAKMVMDLLYLAVLTGSFLSMFLSLIIRATMRPKSPTPPPFNQ